MKNQLMLFAGSLSGIGMAATLKASAQNNDKSKPNVIVILTDDQGYADVGCFGAKGFKTPNIDRMARQGMKLTDFYAGANVSTPSRAALLTGCNPARIDMPNVLFPTDSVGLNPNELTMAEMFRNEGYSTAIVGKWHLGSMPQALPLNHGFDEFFGLPYSNDMRPRVYPGLFTNTEEGIPEYFDLPMYHNDRVIEKNPDQSMLTTRYTEYCTDFIGRHKDKPFFLYMAHSMPHVPLAVSDKFAGKSKAGIYGDVIMEIDWSIGQIYKALRDNGIADNTWVIYISDNGPWLVYGTHGGSAGELREGKGTVFDGGQRVFCLMTWPGVIPARSECREPVSSMDILPTAANHIGGKLSDNKIDGLDIMPLLKAEKGAVSPHDAIYYQRSRRPMAVRCGDWKFMLQHPSLHVTVPGTGGKRGEKEMRRAEKALYNLRDDIREEVNLIGKYPKRAAEMERKLRAFEKELKEEVRPHASYKKAVE